MRYWLHGPALERAGDQNNVAESGINSDSNGAAVINTKYLFPTKVSNMGRSRYTDSVLYLNLSVHAPGAAGEVAGFSPHFIPVEQET